MLEAIVSLQHVIARSLYWTRAAYFDMADFDIDNPVFEPDDWEENIGDDDVLSTSLHDPDVDDDGTSSSERVTIDGTSTSATLSLQQELLQTAVDDYYNAAAEAGLTPSLGRDPGKFELVDGPIRLKAYPNLDLVNKRSGRPLALSTLASRGGTKGDPRGSRFRRLGC